MDAVRRESEGERHCPALQHQLRTAVAPGSFICHRFLPLALFLLSFLYLCLFRHVTALEPDEGIILLVAWVAWRWRKVEREANSEATDLMFAAAVVVSLVTGFHMFTHDLSPLMLSMLLVLAHFPTRREGVLRIVLGATLVLFWIPLLYIALLAWHCVYLLFPVLMVFLWGVMRLVSDQTGPTSVSRGHYVAG